MKRRFYIVALFIVILFIYTISLAQYISLSFLLNILPKKNFFFFLIAFLWLLSFLIAMRILLKQTYAYKKSHWLLIILLNPLLGIILYFIFAREFVIRVFYKKRPLIASKAFLGLENHKPVDYREKDYHEIFDFIRQTTKRAIFQDNTQVKIINNGNEFFPLLKAKLSKAESYIFLESYIIKSDATGKMIMDVLCEKALLGIKVYLIYDHLGSFRHLKKAYLQKLKNAGVKIGVFAPQTISVFNSSLNFRNHRKAIVIDGEVAFMGGMNIADEYNHLAYKFGFWRDTNIMIQGEGVSSVHNVFLKSWYYITGEVLDIHYRTSPKKSDGLFSVIESGPDFEYGLIRDAYLKMLFSAKKSIKIVTPYLIIEPEMMAAIKVAQKSGVEITLIVPGKNDYRMLHFATKSYYEPLLRLGVKIYEYKDHFIHSKILIIDDVIASVGSVNFDPRSFHLNFEVTALFNTEAVKDLCVAFGGDILLSKEITLEHWQKRSIFNRIMEGLFNLFSPIF